MHIHMECVVCIISLPPTTNTHTHTPAMVYSATLSLTTLSLQLHSRGLFSHVVPPHPPHPLSSGPHLAFALFPDLVSYDCIQSCFALSFIHSSI
mmetsp:Transcript_4408/g.6837  ORF Transcript_4408/g.6837 Transcript_4408/m.6837 type:complete len:94 (-) Transcript_4408:178-459(-)